MKNEVTRREAWKSQIIFSIIILWLGTPAVDFTFVGNDGTSSARGERRNGRTSDPGAARSRFHRHGHADAHPGRRRDDAQDLCEGKGRRRACSDCGHDRERLRRGPPQVHGSRHGRFRCKPVSAQSICEEMDRLLALQEVAAEKSLRDNGIPEFVPAFLWLDPDPEKNMQRNLGAGPCKSWKCNDPLEIPSAGALACAPRFPDNMRFNVADFSPQA